MNTPKKKQASRNPLGRPKSAKKRADILAAAELNFMNSGYERTSMDAVAKAALVSKLTIYSHFADKKALFEAVIERKSTQTIAEGYLRFAELPVMEALEEVGINYCNLILNEDAVKWLRMMYVESARDPTSARVYYAVGPQRIKQALIELLRAWAKMNQLNIDDYEAACEQYFSLMRGGVLQKALLGIEKLPTPAYLKKHVKAGVRLFLNTYGFK